MLLSLGAKALPHTNRGHQGPKFSITVKNISGNCLYLEFYKKIIISDKNPEYFAAHFRSVIINRVKIKMQKLSHSEYLVRNPA